MKRPEWAAALAATAILVLLHVVFFVNAGGLWRDEANCVNLSGMPLPELWANLQYDSFPILWFLVLKGWTALGMGSTDPRLRVLGLVVGLAVLAALWRNARRFGVGLPLVSLALVGFNGAIILYGDSMRAYGAGMAMGLLTLGLIWEMVDRPTVRSFVLALAAALLGVQLLYYNAFVIGASCAGGAAVALRRRQPRTIGLLAAVCAVPAFSLLPYRVIFESQKSWNFIVRRPIDMAWLWGKFVEAAQETMPFAAWLWIAAAVLGLAAAATMLRRETKKADRASDVSLFCGAALLTGVPAYATFLVSLSYPMQPWYFVALMALAATCLDGILARPLQGGGLRILRLGLLIGFVALALPGVWRGVHQRRTNLDLVAAKLAESARAGDLVIVSPWWYGVSFVRYYRGPAEWFTIPPVGSHAVHRYDLLKKAMMAPDEIRPLLDRIRDALASGHAIWWVGDLYAPPSGQPPGILPPAPSSQFGWNEGPYYMSWSMQAADVFRRYTVRGRKLAVLSDRPVNRYENPQVTVIQPAEPR